MKGRESLLALSDAHPGWRERDEWWEGKDAAYLSVAQDTGNP
jgi:hypothetical protein